MINIIRELLSHSLITSVQYCHGVLWLLTKYWITFNWGPKFLSHAIPHPLGRSAPSVPEDGRGLWVTFTHHYDGNTSTHMHRQRMTSWGHYTTGQLQIIIVCKHCEICWDLKCSIGEMILIFELISAILWSCKNWRSTYIPCLMHSTFKLLIQLVKSHHIIFTSCLSFTSARGWIRCVRVGISRHLCDYRLSAGHSVGLVHTHSLMNRQQDGS